MKLFYKSATCSLAPHIVLHEAGIAHDIESISFETKKTASGKDFLSINDKGSVPYLLLDNGSGISEVAAIVQYLADLKPDSHLAPANGTLERAHLQGWLNYCASEFHKSHWVIFHAKETGEQMRELFLGKVKKCYDYLNLHLEGKDYIMGSRFTVADAYIFTVLMWHKPIKVDITPWENLVAYKKRVLERDAVQHAMKAEGLI